MRLTILASLALCTACTGGVVTPTRCEQAATGLNTVEDLTAMFVRLGGNPATARKLADAVVAGRMLLAAACAQAGTAAPNTPVQPEL